MFAALLDTSVLWPSTQRDFLISLAVEGLYRPLWSSAILEELHVTEVRKLERVGEPPEMARSRADRLVERMRHAFDDAEVIGWEALEGTFGLPDSDDEHVVAAALLSGAGAIVTSNLKDFPRDRVPDHIDVLSPSEFAASTVAIDPFAAHRALAEMSSRSGRRGPVRSPEDIVAVLVARYGMREVGDLLGAKPGPA
ncbi:MAG: PIN domain-containing protein [Acidimicrobiales bacterium]